LKKGAFDRDDERSGPREMPLAVYNGSFSLKKNGIDRVDGISFRKVEPATMKKGPHLKMMHYRRY